MLSSVDAKNIGGKIPFTEESGSAVYLSRFISDIAAIEYVEEGKGPSAVIRP